MIKKRIQETILLALKERKETELRVLRFLLSLVNYEEIAKGKELSEEEIIALFQKEVKKRKEAIEMFKKGKRDDLVKKEEEELAIIQRYLPKQLSDEELEKIIEEIIRISGESNIGKIIGMVIKRTKGRVDGAKVASLVQKKIQK